MADERGGKRDKPRTPQQQPQLKLELRHHGTKVIAGTTKISLEVLATKGSSALGGQQVQFYIGPIKNGSAVTTDENGRATTELQWESQEKDTEIFIEAQLVGTATGTKIPLKIPADSAKKTQEPKTVDKLGLVATDRHDGVWAISIAAWTQNNLPAGNVAIEISHAGKIETATTNKHGFARCSAIVTERVSKLIVQAPGIQKSIDLLGPKNPKDKINNIRAGVFLTFVISCLIGLAAIDHFYLTPPVTQFQEFSDIEQRALNLYMSGKTQTDLEMMSWHKPDLSSLDKFWTLSWWMLALASFYFIWAFHEELVRGWTTAWANTQELVNLPDLPTTTTNSETKKPMSWMEQVFKQGAVFGREVLSAVLGELVAGERRIMR
ncbi:MAG: hypothetical protein Q8Q90_03655 [bacterium]|nr:hypothetical protein [bacterium]